MRVQNNVYIIIGDISFLMSILHGSHNSAKEGKKCFQGFEVCLDRTCDMWTSIVLLEYKFVVSLLIMWPFLLQCSAPGSNVSIASDTDPL